MFEFLFKYSPAAFEKGELVLLGSWPAWLLPVLILVGAGGLGWWTWQRRQEFSPSLKRWRPVAIWGLQAAMLSLLLLLLWQPALRLSTLKPQQNVVAVVVDDSRSMSLDEGGQTRSAAVVEALQGGLLDELGNRFQVRLYRLGGGLERIPSLDRLTADNQATRIGDGLREMVAESASLPIGAVVLLSDGADNEGGIDPETVAEVRSRRIPVHTVGFGREQFDRDIEIVDVQTPPRALAGSRLMAQITIRQRGYGGESARVTIRESGKVLASDLIELDAEVPRQTASLLFNAGAAGAKSLDVAVDLLPGEQNEENNSISRLVNVEDSQPRVLYLEGEPRWEYKFIRRALQEDDSVELVSILRTTQNKIYRQGIDDPHELEEGFPDRVDELFEYQGLVLGSVEVSYFTSTQQELIRQFVDRRGGGVLFLGGRAALSEGGYPASSIQDLLPVRLPERTGTFHRVRAGVRLTGAGRDSLITRLEEDPDRNVERWRELPPLADYQEIGEPKPGAVVLSEVIAPGGRELPLLVTQHYGRGRSAVFATGGSWRWQMQQEVEDKSHEMYWQQLMRWLVTGTPGHVNVSVPEQMLYDEGRVSLTAAVRDKTYGPLSDARVEARIMGPGGVTESVEMTPDPHQPGIYTADWNAFEPGSFIAEVVAFRQEEEVGRDVITFQRQDGIAESFRAEQNRELLEKLSEQTGGRYYSPDTLGKLADEISFSEAGITVRETRDLWNMPAVFFALLLLKGIEWFWRRKWGVV